MDYLDVGSARLSFKVDAGLRRELRRQKVNFYFSWKVKTTQRNKKFFLNFSFFNSRVNRIEYIFTDTRDVLIVLPQFG
jgi:hypothetical protein